MAINRNDFFDKKAKGALWDVGVSIKRGNPLPLDADSVFKTKADAEIYAKGVISYPGQVIAVVEEAATQIYYLDQTCALQPIGGAAQSNAISSVVGQDGDLASADTIFGAKRHATDLADALKGVEGDTLPDKLTLYALKKYAEDLANGALTDAQSYADELVGALAAVASSGKAADVSIEDASNKITATNVEGALKEIVEKADANTAAIEKLNGLDTVEGSVAKAVKEAKDAIEGEIGSLTGLSTSEKGTVVGAINEVKGALDTAVTNADITVETSPVTEGYLKSYIIKQGGEHVATIDIPKDLVVESGSVVTNPDEEHVGTFIKLVIANQTEPLYINVANLVDVYTAKASATEVQLAFNGYEVSATLVDGGVSTAKLADAAITTAKIANAAVTEAKLGTDSVTTAKIKNGSVTRAKIDSAFEAQIAGLEAAVGDGGDIDTRISTAIEALDAELSQVAGADGLALSLTQVDGEVTSISGSIKANTYDSYGAASSVKSELLGTDESLATSETLKGHRKAITALKGLVGNESVSAQITSTIEGLDAKVSHADAGDGLTLSITQVNGVITEIAGAIAADTYDVHGAAAGVLGNSEDTHASATVFGAKKYADHLNSAMDARVDELKAAIGAGGSVAQQITSAIEELDASINNSTESTANGIAISITQTDGKVSAVSASITSISDSEIDALFATI